jgi:hypothetical protein
LIDITGIWSWLASYQQKRPVIIIMIIIIKSLLNHQQSKKQRNQYERKVYFTLYDLNFEKQKWKTNYSNTCYSNRRFKSSNCPKPIAKSIEYIQTINIYKQTNHEKIIIFKSTTTKQWE